MKMICENAGKCEKKPCKSDGFRDHSVPHELYTECFNTDCVYFDGIEGSKCIPYVELQTVADDVPAMLDALDKRKKANAPKRVKAFKDEVCIELGESKERARHLSNEVTKLNVQLAGLVEDLTVSKSALNKCGALLDAERRKVRDLVLNAWITLGVTVVTIAVFLCYHFHLLSR